MATIEYHFIIQLLFYSFSEDDVCTKMFEELFLSVRSDGGYEWLRQRLLRYQVSGIRYQVSGIRYQVILFHLGNC